MQNQLPTRYRPSASYFTSMSRSLRRMHGLVPDSYQRIKTPISNESFLRK